MHSRFAIARQALVVACASVAIVGVGYVFAAPTAPPPGSTVDLPLTRGSNAETKTGPLTVAARFTANEICLGGSCKTTWPTSNLQVGYTTVTGQANLVTSTYNYYGSHTYYYWYYNQLYSQYTNYYFYDQNFSVTMPLQVTGVPLNASLASSVRCYLANSGYGYTPAPTSNYYTQSSFWTDATNVSVSVSGTNVVVSGSCRLYLNNGYWNYNYFVVPVSASVQYLY